MVYYQYDNSAISDYEYDSLCKELLSRIEKGEKIPKEFEEHITKDNLVAGTGYNIAYSMLPQILRTTAHILHTGCDFSVNKINMREWLK